MARWGTLNTWIVQLLVISLIVVPCTATAKTSAPFSNSKNCTSNRNTSGKYAKKSPLQTSGNTCNFRKTSWGMSPAEVKATESADFFVEDWEQGQTEQVAGIPAKVAGIPAEIHYVFSDDKLIRGIYSFTKKHGNLSKHLDEFSKLKKMLEQTHGKPEAEETIWSSDQYKDDPQNWGLAVQRGDLSHVIQWKTASTSIKLHIRGYDSEIIQSIVYESTTPRLKYTHFDNVFVGYMAYVVTGAEWSQSLSANEYLDQRPNAAYLKVRLAARNDDTTARMVPPFKLVDERGAEYESTSKAWVRSDSFDLETLNPSVTKQGIVIFDVPPDRQYRLKVSGGYWSGEYAYIRLRIVDLRDINIGRYDQRIDYSSITGGDFPLD